MINRTLLQAVMSKMGTYCAVCDSHDGGHRLSCPTLGVVPVLDLEPNPKILELTAMTTSVPAVRHDHDHTMLENRFLQALEYYWPEVAYGPKPIFPILDERYAAPGRTYHDWSHIHTMLDVLDFLNAEAGGRLKQSDVELIVLAIFFHDVEMNFTRFDNEERSVEFMRSTIGTGKDSVLDRLSHMIMATKHKTVDETDFLTQVFLDIDLWGLGDPDFDRFYDTTARIRAEYVHVEDMTFLRNRILFMKHIRDGRRGPVFYNPMMVNSLLTRETAALTNLSMEITKFESIIADIDYLNRYIPKKE